MTTIDTAPDILQVVVPAEGMAGPPQGHWTYADYAALLDDGARYELINGVLYMSPAPNIGHQSANRWFIFYLTMHVQLPGLGQVFGAPCDVELAPDVVSQPDVLVVLNANAGIITPSRIIGAPDLVIEIVSPSTAGYDRRTKQDAYAHAGVAEYWIADPAARAIELLTLEQGTYRSRNAFRGKALLPSKMVPGLPVQVEQFFV